jgi:hypothetical protein
MPTQSSCAHASRSTAKEAGFPDLTFDGLVGFFGVPTCPTELRDSYVAGGREAAFDPANQELRHAS